MNIDDQIFCDGVDAYLQLRRDADIKNLHRAGHFRDEVIDRIHGEEKYQGITLPWEMSFQDFRLRRGEVSIIAGDSGSGKSLLSSQLVLKAIEQKAFVVIASMEMKPNATLERMCRQVIGNREPSVAQIDKVIDRLDQSLLMYDQQGKVTPETMLALTYYAGEETKAQEGQTVLVIDSLMTVGVKGDDFNAQRDFVNELCTIAMDTGVHVVLICHNRKGEKESRRPDKFDIAGSTDISNRVDNIFQFWRNKQKEAEARKPETQRRADVMDRPDAILACVKQRHATGEVSEPAYGLYYYQKGDQYCAQDRYEKMRLLTI